MKLRQKKIIIKEAAKNNSRIELYNLWTEIESLISSAFEA